VAEIDEKVMAFVEETLQQNPGMKLTELFERAREVSPSIGELDKRQFNARYPLQVKRSRAQAPGGGSRPKGKSKPKARGPSTGRRSRARSASTPGASGDDRPSREAVRQVLLQFAVDIVGAEERKQLVKVLARVDHYVDKVVQAMGRA
jgi:hypothetical protein